MTTEKSSIYNLADSRNDQALGRSSGIATTVTTEVAQPSDAKMVVTRGEIVAHLRQRITSGEFAPGSRLPTYRGLQTLLQANMVTVSRAIDQLKGEGFIGTQGARGMFVVDHPPHLFRYALVFPSHPSESDWPRFWEALAKEAGTVEREGPCEMTIYYDVNQIARPDMPSYHKLVEDVHAHCFAGLIFAADPWVVNDTPLLSEPGMPCVSITHPQPQAYPNVATVDLDNEGLIHKAFDYLAARGRKRLAVLSAPTEVDRLRGMLEREASRRGMETRPYWIQSVSPMSPKPAQACMHLLMHGGQSQRPDALFVMDDNLMESAIAGLVDSGVRVPTDLDVVAHCNFPWPTPAVLPVQRIGFDARQCLRACMKSIDAQRQDKVMPPHVTISALFEDELDSGSLVSGRSTIQV